MRKMKKKTLKKPKSESQDIKKLNKKYIKEAKVRENLNKN